MAQQSLLTVSLTQIIQGCKENASARRRLESQKPYCFELFRRAIDDQEDPAWKAIVSQYHALICHWIFKSAPKTYTHDEVSDLAVAVFERFWRTLTTRSISIAERFEHIGAVLNYLKQCAISLVRDQIRKTDRENRLLTRLHSEPHVSLPRHFENKILERVQKEHLLTTVRTWVQTSLKDEQEQLLWQYTFVQELSPQEIARQNPELFPDVATVYRIKGRILKRAQRNLQIA